MNNTLTLPTARGLLEEIPTRMNAAVISAPRTVRFVEVDVPEPNDEQALVNLEGCGLCASSNPLWEGRPWFSYPLPYGNPGHEGWGRVVRAGHRSVHQVGQRVATLIGNAFAPYALVGNEQAVLLPPQLEQLPFPGEPLGCVMNVLDRSRILPGATVAVIGMGFIGSLVARMAHARGAQVIALSRRGSMLERLPVGIRTIRYQDTHDGIRQVMALTANAGVERVIECTGHQEPLTMATDVVAEHGMIVIAGYHQDGLRQVDLQKWNWKGIDVINAHERDHRRYVRGVQEAIQEVLAGRLDPREHITHWFAFEELAQALELTSRSEDHFIKACIEFE
jgi:threonine dehydrogenase-like Zn-dependent dehydrogenase